MKKLSTPEPPPRATKGESIHDLVVADLKERKAMGLRKYGTPLQAFNGRRALRDAYQEALDLTCYLRQLIEELESFDFCRDCGSAEAVNQHGCPAQMVWCVKQKVWKRPFDTCAVYAEPPSVDELLAELADDGVVPY